MGWASRVPLRCGLYWLDNGGRKCSRARLRPPRRCLLRLRGLWGLLARAPLRDCVSSKHPAPTPRQSPGPCLLCRCWKPEEEPALLVGGGWCVCVCVCPQSEEMPEGGGLGRCQVGVVRRRGERPAGGALPRAAVAGEEVPPGEVALARRRPRSPPAGRRVYVAFAFSRGPRLFLTKVGSSRLMAGSRV